MKKIYSLLCILCLSLFVFAGCGETTTNSETTTTNISEDTNVETTSNSSVSEEVIVSVEEVHEHEFVYSANDDFTHTKSCKVCDEVSEVEDCTFDVIDAENPIVCSICGFSHTHDEILSAKDNEDGTHTLFCETCKNKFGTEEHIIKDNENKEVCDICSYTRTLWEEEPIESTTKYVKASLNIRMKPTKESDLVENLSTNSEVTIVAHVSEYNGEKCNYYKLSTGGYAHGDYLVDEKVVIQNTTPANSSVNKAFSTADTGNPLTRTNQGLHMVGYCGDIYFNSYDEMNAWIKNECGYSIEELSSTYLFSNTGYDNYGVGEELPGGVWAIYAGVSRNHNGVMISFWYNKRFANIF